jgi:C4-dicarboxylate-specific signal transduction histidine kinase
MPGDSAAPTMRTGQPPSAETENQEQMLEELGRANAALRDQLASQRQLLRRGEDRQRAMLHIMVDINEANRRLADHRKAMLHILSDYERDRHQLAHQTAGLRDTRRALLHILQDAHRSNQQLERSRKAMIHIMGDLRVTTLQMQRREEELREKQEQLVQAAKLATLGELTTGVAHELNNPLNNIGLFVGNAIDLLERGRLDSEPLLRQLKRALEQVEKATEVISHLRTFGRLAAVRHGPLQLNTVIEQALSLMSEQFRLREIEVVLDLAPEEALVMGNPIQLEQVMLNLLTNARDALADFSPRAIYVSTRIQAGSLQLVVRDTGPGIPPGLEQRIFDPFFTTKEVGAGTGLGLSITYGIIKDHSGSISVESRPGEGAVFLIKLPLAEMDQPADGPQ